MDKSYVTMEQKICIVCGAHYDTNAILLDNQLRKTFDHKTTTGFGMCEEHEKLKNEGYIALVACDAEKSNAGNKSTLQPDEVYRTGRIAHVKREAWEKIFNIDCDNPIAFIDDEAMDKIEQIKEKS